MKTTTGMKPKAPAKSFKIKKAKYSSPHFMMAADGMKLDGPSHEDGGIEARTPEGKPVAEVEGGERIFSQEDTDYLENAAQEIVSLLQQNPDSAKQAAQKLGFKVVDMIINQERNQRAQEGGETGGADQAAEAMNSFASAGDNEGDNFD